MRSEGVSACVVDLYGIVQLITENLREYCGREESEVGAVPRFATLAMLGKMEWNLWSRLTGEPYRSFLSVNFGKFVRFDQEEALPLIHELGETWRKLGIRRRELPLDRRQAAFIGNIVRMHIVLTHHVGMSVDSTLRAIGRGRRVREIVSESPAMVQEFVLEASAMVCSWRTLRRIERIFAPILSDITLNLIELAGSERPGYHKLSMRAMKCLREITKEQARLERRPRASSLASR